MLWGLCKFKVTTLWDRRPHRPRVSALAGPGEVLVSSTVKDLVAGSGIAFADRGSHVLKGVPNEWRVFAVKS
jgi:class 3 adenylate cyclase